MNVRQGAAGLGPTLPVLRIFIQRGGRAGLESASIATMSRHLLTLGHINVGLVQTRAGGHCLTDKGLALAKRMASAARKVEAAGAI
jgi:hypothetical protein